MKYTLLFLLSGLIFFSVNGQNHWVQMDSVNGAPRSVSSCFVLGGEAYVAGGLDEGGFRRKMYSYTLSQDDWDQEESIGGPTGSGLNRGSAFSFVMNEKAYVFGGQGETNGFFQDMWEYDLATQTWSQKADFAGGPRRQGISFALNDMGFAGLGSSPSGLKKDMYKYDPIVNHWVQLNDFAGTARKEAAYFVMGVKAYVGTGDDGVMRNDFWEYDDSNDSWTQLADFPGTPRKGAVGFGVFPNGYICTGEDLNFNYKNDLWQYNYYLDNWEQKADLPGPGRSNGIAFVLEGFCFVGTGFNGIFFDDLYAYVPVLSTESITKDDIQVYPNPIRDQFTIKSKEPIENARIIDASGKDVTNFVQLSEISNGYLGNRNGLPAGNYYLQFSHKKNNELNTEKLIFVQ